MNRRQVEHILRAAGAITGRQEWVIVGSQAILGALSVTVTSPMLARTLARSHLPRYLVQTASSLRPIIQHSFFVTRRVLA